MRRIRRSGVALLTISTFIHTFELQVGGTWYEVRTLLTLAHFSIKNAHRIVILELNVISLRISTSEFYLETRRSFYIYQRYSFEPNPYWSELYAFPSPFRSDDNETLATLQAPKFANI